MAVESRLSPDGRGLKCTGASLGIVVEICLGDTIAGRLIAICIERRREYSKI